MRGSVIENVCLSLHRSLSVSLAPDKREVDKIRGDRLRLSSLYLLLYALSLSAVRHLSSTSMLEIPSKIIALLCEFNDDTTKSARYVRSWPPAVEPVTKKEYEDFYERIGEGDVRLGQESKLLFFVNSYRFLIQFVDAISHFFFFSFPCHCFCLWL